MNGPEYGDQRKEVRFEFDDPQMQEFERALSHAMRRVDVPAGMTAKLLAAAEEAEQKAQHAGGGFRRFGILKGGRLAAMPRIPQARMWMGGAIAAVLAVGCFVGAHIHTVHEQKVQAERQFEAAERITDQALEHTREQLRAQGIYLDQ